MTKKTYKEERQTSKHFTDEDIGEKFIDRKVSTVGAAQIYLERE